jgi:hypothetical protein
VSLHIAHYNLVRTNESLRSTPAEALGLTDHAWSIGELLDAALTVATPDPTETGPDRRRRFQPVGKDWVHEIKWFIASTSRACASGRRGISDLP